MKLKKSSVIVVLVTLIMFSSAVLQSSVNIVFDLGGVFIKRSRKGLLKHAGIKELTNLILRGKNIKKLLFDLLNKVPLPGELSEEDLTTCDDHGKPCATALLHWLKGNASGREIIEAVECYYETANCGYTERIVIKRIIQAIFDPDLFEQTTEVFQKTLDFLQECINRGYKIYILSNLDRGSYEALDVMLLGFFDLFDGVIISADVKMMKPNQALFLYLLETYNLKPEETVFIDDQQENLKAAEEVGIFPIKCSSSGWMSGSPDIKKVKKNLNRWLVKKIDKEPVYNCV